MKHILFLLYLTFSLNFAQDYQWKTIRPNLACDLKVISVVNNKVVWVGSDGGYVSKSNDGGLNWSVHKIGGTSIISMSAVNDSICFVILNNDSATQILRTIDGGENWSIVYELNDPQAYLNNIYMFDNKNGIAIGRPINGKYLILKTNNQGLSWEPGAEINSNDDDISIRNSMFWLDDYGWFGTDTPFIYMTTDKGKTWKKIETNLSRVYSIAFVDSLNGLISGTGKYSGPAPLPEPHLSLTRNGGKTWQEISIRFYPGFINSVAMIDSNDLWCVHYGYVWRSVDGGQNWEKLYSNNDDLYGLSLKKSNNYIYCWAYGEKALLANYYESTTNIEGNSTVEKSFRLLYNYPNPFNPVTKINFFLPKSSKVIIDIYNLQGKKLSTPINAIFPAGNQSIPVKMDKFATGIYIYRIRAGQYQANGKMVLLK